MFPIVAGLALLIIIPFSWSASSFPQSGGPAAYGAVFGRFAGFELGWTYYIARAAAFAANANVLTFYFPRRITRPDEGHRRAPILLGATAHIAAGHAVGRPTTIGQLW